jgi:hypothetical protein
MLPINLKCVCGQELEVIPKTLKALGAIAKANGWKLIGGGRIGHDKAVAAHCPSCSQHHAKIQSIQKEPATHEG